MFGVENVIHCFVDVMIMMEMKLIVVERGTWMVSNTVLMDTSGLTGKSKRGCWFVYGKTKSNLYDQLKESDDHICEGRQGRYGEFVLYQ